MATELDWYILRNLKARQLQLLVALDDHGSLKKVAEATHITLPAVSKALAELEKGLGLQLFSRTPSGVRPTVYGACLIRYARTVLIELQQARDELKALSSGSGGKVNVGAYVASTSVLLPRTLANLKERSPLTNVFVIEGTGSILLPQLWEGKLDLVVGRLPPLSPSSGFDEKVLLEEPLRLVVGPQHPLARRKRVNWSDLAEYPWVLPPLPAQIRVPVDLALSRHGIDMDRNYIETASSHLTREYLYLNEAIGAMANAAAHDPSMPVKILPLALPKVNRGVGILWNRNRPLSPAAQMMIECFDEIAEELRRAESQTELFNDVPPKASAPRKTKRKAARPTSKRSAVGKGR